VSLVKGNGGRDREREIRAVNALKQRVCALRFDFEANLVVQHGSTFARRTPPVCALANTKAPRNPGASV